MLSPLNDMLDSDGEHRIAASGRPLGAISTLTSLFLILLVFFILLYSIASAQHDQLNRLLKSVDAAFGGIPSVMGMRSSPEPEQDENTPAGFANAVSQVITGFAAPLTEGVGKSGADTLIALSVPTAEIFTDATVLTARGQTIATRLAVLLQRHPTADQHYRLRFRVAPDTAAAAQATNFAAALYRAGGQADRVTISADSAVTGKAVFEFSLTSAAGARE